MEGIGYCVDASYYGFPGTEVKDTTEIYWGLNFDCDSSGGCWAIRMFCPATR